MILLLSLFLAFSSHAGLLLAEPGGKEIEKVKIAQSAQAKVGDRAYSLQFVGAALRWKKVAFFKADVYVGQFFVSDAAKFNKAAPMDSLANLKAVAISLSFLRDVEAKKILSAFEDGFTENKISLEDPSIKAFLEAVKAGPEAKKNSTLTVLGEKMDQKEIITFEDAQGKTTSISGPAGFLKNVFSLWLGKMPDSGLEEFQKALLGN